MVTAQASQRRRRVAGLVECRPPFATLACVVVVPAAPARLVRHCAGAAAVSSRPGPRGIARLSLASSPRGCCGARRHRPPTPACRASWSVPSPAHARLCGGQRRLGLPDPSLIPNALHITVLDPSTETPRDVYVYSFRAKSWDASRATVDACQQAYAGEAGAGADIDRLDLLPYRLIGRDWSQIAARRPRRPRWTRPARQALPSRTRRETIRSMSDGRSGRSSRVTCPTRPGGPARATWPTSRLARFLRASGEPDLTALQRRAAEDPAWFWGAAADDLGIALATPPARGPGSEPRRRVGALVGRRRLQLRRGGGRPARRSRPGGPGRSPGRARTARCAGSRNAELQGSRSIGPRACWRGLGVACRRSRRHLPAAASRDGHRGARARPDGRDLHADLLGLRRRRPPRAAWPTAARGC